jgi:tetratricopeptide (TPR) repeat protein
MFRIIITAFACCVLLFSCGNDEKAKPPVSNRPIEESIMDSITAEIVKAKNFQGKAQYQEALRITDAMLQKFPGQLDALNIKAEILKEQGKQEEALALMEKAYAFQPKDKETAYNLAYEYAVTKNAKALSLSDTLIKYDKTETVARAWYIKATYYNNLGNKKETMRFLDSSIIANYNFTDAYFDKGQIQFEQRNFEGALKTFATGQKLAPTEAQFYFWIAKTQEMIGNKTDAKANYERAYILDKNMMEAKEAAERL